MALEKTHGEAGGGAGMNLRHAVRILRAAAELEGLASPSAPPGPPLDRALQTYQRARRNMGRNDRLVLGTAVYQLARQRALLGRAAEGVPAGPGSLLLLALLDAVGERSDLGGIRHLPDGVRPWRRQLAWLRRERQRLGEGVAAAGSRPLAAAPQGVRDALETLYAVPGWWLEQGPWGTVGEAAAELAALRRPQRLILRVQAHRAPDRTAVLGRLTDLGIPCEPAPRSPWGLVVAGRHNVLATAPYRDGTVEVQDEGSQLVACLMDPKPGEHILDACAGGGGKSLALASAMGGRGEVVAHDPHAGRLRDARRRARRAGLGNVRVAEGPAEVERRDGYDQVLVDAPCTSSGTLRRNPDVAWRWDEAALAELAATQAAILDRVASLVRPGGFLVYATCSLFPAENGNQVEAFLARHREFCRAPLGDRAGHGALAGVPGFGDGQLRLAADQPRYAGDGFFMARLRREE